MASPGAAKRPVNLTVSTHLLDAARSQDINLSATLEAALETELARLRRARWLERNAKAISAYNEDVEKHGSFGDTLRGF